MSQEDLINIPVTRRDAGRILNEVSQRKRKLARGVTKFGENFDPNLGKNIAEGLEAYTALEQILKEAIHGNDHSRSAGRDTSQHEGRRDAPGDHRPTRQQAD